MLSCPRCLNDYTGRPALSRRDNRTEICSQCGQEEAMNDFLPFRDLSRDQIDMERTFSNKLGSNAFMKWLKTKYSFSHEAGGVYNFDGFDEDGFHRNGTKYDEFGFDKRGFNRDGYNYTGFAYDEYGFDYEGYNRNGFDRDGFDKYGFDKYGYDRHGYDENGFDVSGFDEYGFDKRGRNRTGYEVYKQLGKQSFDDRGIHKNQIKCSACRDIFEDLEDFNDHSCVSGQSPNMAEPIFLNESNEV